MDFQFKAKNEKYTVEDMVSIVHALRAPDGCPWDKVQTHESIRRDFIEEVYEAVEAIDEGSVEHLREELGDVLFQVVFHTVLESEKNHFELNDVTDEVCRKMIIRHPHVFGNVNAENTDEVLKNWDAIKMQTKSQKKSSESLESVSKALPALIRADKLQKKVQRMGIEKKSTEELFSEIETCFDELKQAVKEENKNLYEKKIGEILFSIAGVGGNLSTDCEKMLYHACENFTEQFRGFEAQTEEKGISIQDSDVQTLNHLWKEYSKKEQTGGN